MTVAGDVRIVETTIRDGSYEVEFQYTASDIATLATLLDHAGLSYIEVGHGRGLAGHLRGNTPPLTDEQHLRAARASVRHAKLGAIICFTGREAEAERLVDLATDCGLDFLRLGMSAKMFRSPVVQRVLEKAGRTAMTVSVNFMRSYSLPAEDLATLAVEAVDRGADWIYVVDSAGCMLPEETEHYVRTLAARVRARIGFHGHNNLSLAVANSLAAIRGGATLVDTTLQGLGRATGNAPTETMAALLKERLGGEAELDLPMLAALGRKYVRPFVTGGFDPTDVLAGAARIHSGCLASLRQHSATAGVHPDEVVLAVGTKARAIGALERKDLPAELVSEAAGELRRRDGDRSSLLDGLARELATGVRAEASITDVLRELQICALRDKLSTSLVVVAERWSLFPRPWIHRRDGAACGIVPLGSASSIEEARRVLAEPPAWLARVYVDDALAVSSPGAIVVSPLELVAIAVTAGLRARPVVLAIDDEALRSAIERRIPRDCELVRDPEACPAGARWIVQGRTVPMSRLASDADVVVIGATGVTLAELAVARPDVRVASPDLASLVELSASLLLQVGRALAVSPSGTVLDGGGVIGQTAAPGDAFVVEHFRRALEDLARGHGPVADSD